MRIGSTLGDETEDIYALAFAASFKESLITSIYLQQNKDALESENDLMEQKVPQNVLVDIVEKE